MFHAVVTGIDLVTNLDVDAAIIYGAKVTMSLEHDVRVVARIQSRDETVFVLLDASLGCDKCVLICH